MLSLLCYAAAVAVIVVVVVVVVAVVVAVVFVVAVLLFMEWMSSLLCAWVCMCVFISRFNMHFLQKTSPLYGKFNTLACTLLLIFCNSFCLSSQDRDPEYQNMSSLVATPQSVMSHNQFLTKSSLSSMHVEMCVPLKFSIYAPIYK